MQASYLYFTHGVWDDWMYGIRDVFAFTCEIFGNDTLVREPGPYPNTFWEGGIKYCFNPYPSAIEGVVLRWLPVFFYIAKQALANIAVEKVESDRTAVGQGCTADLNI